MPEAKSVKLDEVRAKIAEQLVTFSDESPKKTANTQRSRALARRASVAPLGLDPTPEEYALVPPKTIFGPGPAIED